ncbi:MAG TPA: hypothetical protein EYG71_01310 [Leucothrix sp.]|nr:hypothetical protein [Leucothrix sp.]
MFKHKLKAAALHLLLSLVVISFAIGLIVYFWFPNSLVHVSNFREIALLIMSIDLILGPLLTFVIFKPKKKYLKFDLSAIATFQSIALAYGLFTLYQAHPVYIAFNVDRFTLVSAMDAKPEEALRDELKNSKFSSPKIVVAKIPKDKKESSDLLMDVMDGAPDIEFRPNLYHPFEENISEILAKSLDPNIIFKDDKAQEKLSTFIKKYGKTTADYAYLPLIGGAKDAVWVLDNKTAKPIDVIVVDPWATVATNKAKALLLEQGNNTSNN